VRGLVNLKGFPRVSIPYGKRTGVASTNVPDSYHYSADPPQKHVKRALVMKRLIALMMSSLVIGRNSHMPEVWL